MSLVELSTTRKKQAKKFLELEQEFNKRKDKKYEVETIQNNAIYNKVAKSQ